MDIMFGVRRIAHIRTFLKSPHFYLGLVFLALLLHASHSSQHYSDIAPTTRHGYIAEQTPTVW
jgi:hypothetical protein